MEEDTSKIEFNPEEENKNINETSLDISKVDISIHQDDQDDNDDDYKNEEILLKILDDRTDKETEKENKNIESFEKNNKSMIKSYLKNNNISPSELKYSENKLAKKLEQFFLMAYEIISQKNYDRIIEDEDEEENTKEIEHLHNLINQIILEKKNNNCEISIIYGNKEKTVNERFFTLNLYVNNKISKFHGLLNMQIIFKVKIEMSIRSGNVEFTISKCSLNYENKKQEIIIQTDFKCLLINNKLGNYGITYCECGDCVRCKNKSEPKPFDDILFYLRKKNKIGNKVDSTDLWFGKYNKYRNESGYKCSFCQDFFKNKLNVVKLFCNPDYDSDHTCQFWICRKCYFKKRNINEKCPNCEKFIINFKRLSSIYAYLTERKKMY